jgi:RNA polymerase sigma factor (sigma-70 family)
MKNNQEQLETIVRQAQAGETEAYSLLVRRFQDMAVGYSYSILGDFSLAEDAAQEAFINAYCHLSQLREAAAFPGWFRRVVFKQCDRLVRGKQLAKVALDDVSDQIAADFDPVATFEQQEVQIRVRQAITMLPLHEREVVTLFYISQYSQKEIATFLELPVSTVKSRLHTARGRLKERMMTVLQENLPKQRPSRDNEFTEKVMSFLKSVAEGDTTAIKTLLSEEPALAQATGLIKNPLWGSEASALHVAVMYGRKDIVDLLLAHGADIDEKDEKYGFTALHHAVDLADFLSDYATLEMPEFLISRGAKKDIFISLWQGDYQGVKAFLEADPDSANTIGPNQATPLCYARTVEMAQLLLDHGADMHAELNHGCGISKTPIQWNAHNPKVLSFLLDRAGVDIDIFLACVLGDTEQVAAALKSDASLVQARTGVEHVLEADFTPLHLAAKYGHIEIAKLLLKAGADVNATAPAVNNMTPLHLAVWLGRKEEPDALPEMSQFLQQPGVLRLSPEMPRLLLEHGADVKARDSERNLTPLGWAEARHEDETDRSEVIALLREFGAEA